MPATKKTANTKKTSSKSARSAKRKDSWLSRAINSRYAKPMLFALAFMVIGVTGLLWASAATTTESLWSSSTVPSVLTWSDRSNIELGTKFQTSVAGYVTGIRFYKGPQNTGTHTGTLWDASGHRIAGVTFTNETRSGWQTAMLPAPVSIAANATYVVSYHAPNGHYSLGPDYFKSGAHISGHLTAPKFSASNPNGVFAKSTAPTFPTTNGDGDSYFVDVLFSAKLINPQPAPAAPTGVTASPNNDNTQVALAWQPSVSQNPIAQYIVYRNGSKLGSAGAMTTYTDTAITAGSTYSYQVQAIDNTGVSSALSTAVKVTIPSPPSSGGGGGTTSGWPDATNTGYKPTGVTLHTCSTNIGTSGTYDSCEFDGPVVISGVCTGSVKITRSLIKGQVVVKGPGSYEYTPGKLAPNAGCSDQGVVISDTTIDCGCQSGSSAEFPASSTPVVVAGLNFTLLRDDISNGGHGVAPDEFVTVQDSYIHNLGGNTDAHKDGLFISDGDHMTFKHNNIECNDGPLAGCTAAIGILNDFSDETYLTFDNNLLNTNGAYCFYGGGKIDAKPYRSSYITFTNNHFGRKYYPNCAFYGPVTYWDASQPGMVWSGNVWDDTGAAVQAVY